MRQTLGYKKWILGILALMILASCQTVDFPEPANQGADEPVFKFEGTVNGEATAFAAGNNDYFMETSTVRDNSGVHTFIGHLKPSACESDCPNSLKFIVRDVDVSTSPNPVNVNAALQNGTLSFTNPNPQDSIGIAVKTWPSDQDEFEYSVIFEDEILKRNDAMSYNLGPVQEGLHITLQGKHKEGLVTFQLTQPVSLSGSENRLRAELKFVENKLTITLKTGSDKAVILWNFNDAEGSTLVLEENPKQRISAEVEFTNGERAEFKISFSDEFEIGSIKTVPKVELDYEVEKIPNKNIRQFRTIEVVYFDEAGRAFSSLNAPQASGSIFRINGSDEFQVDANGRKTRKIDFELDMMAADVNGNSIDVSGKGVFALAYP